MSSPMNWYFQDRQQSKEPRELTLTMKNNLTLNRIRVTMEYSLIFNPFRNKDNGIYRCYKLSNSTIDNRYSYRLERKILNKKNFNVEWDV